jgi:hypothetical protein
MKNTLRLSALGILAAVVVSCSMFDYSGIQGNKYALVYGVTRYTMDPAGPNLSYPHMDAIAISAVLASNGYTVGSRWVDGIGRIFTNGNDSTKLIGSLIATNSSGSPTTGENPDVAVPGLVPSKTNILADIQALSGVIRPNDVLVVYFSGHGTQDASGTPPHEYFDPYGSVMEDGTQAPGKFYDYPALSVRDDDLRAAFDAINTPRKVLILDTCNSGGFIGNPLEADWTASSSAGSLAVVGPGTLGQAIANYANMQASPTGLSPYGAQVISAAGRDESCYETGSPISHGIMTYFLLNGLKGAADLNQDGHTTVLEAFAYAKAGIDQNWNPSPPPGTGPFEPHISGGPVDFVLF